ncbi:MAG: hypothetical protein IJL48_06340 [Bacteroidales bacterium]|nr:hypothetical protein [Bacteroidales bacterium]
MSTEIVKPHNFVEAKEKIDKLVKNVPSTTNLKQFREKKFIFSSTPTGKELNEQIVSPLQNIFIDVNNNVRSLYDIISNLYKTIELLDDEYIKAIILAIKSIEEVSNQAKTASDNAERASKKAFEASQDALKVSKEVKTAQADIKKTIDALGATVKILKDFRGKVNEDITSLQQYRSKLESYKHLRDVDNMWSDVDGHKTDLAKLHQQVDGFIESANKATDLIKQDVSSLQQYRSKLETYKHLCEVDNIWNDVEGQKTDLAKFHQQVDGFIESANKATDLIKQDVSSLQQYSSKLETYKHLGDVDNIWNDVEDQKTDLANFHQQVDGFMESANKATGSIQKDIAALQQYRSKLETYKHLGDVDNMWRDLNGHKTDLANFHQHVDGFMESANKATGIIQKDITILQRYRSKLEAYRHLGDVDDIWSDVENHKAELTKFHQQVTNHISEVNKTHAEIKDSIRRIEEANSSAHLKYEKKIKAAYYIGGSAIGLIIINYILLIMGIL